MKRKIAICIMCGLILSIATSSPVAAQPQFTMGDASGHAVVPEGCDPEIDAVTDLIHWDHVASEEADPPWEWDEVEEIWEMDWDDIAHGATIDCYVDCLAGDGCTQSKTVNFTMEINLSVDLITAPGGNIGTDQWHNPSWPQTDLADGTNGNNNSWHGDISVTNFAAIQGVKYQVYVEVWIRNHDNSDFDYDNVTGVITVV